MLKKPNNPGLKKLPLKVRNNMGYAATGGSVQTKVKKVIKGLKKASKLHAGQAKTLSNLLKKIK